MADLECTGRMMKKRYAELWVLPGALALALAFISPPAWAQGFFEQFKDPIDGRLDTSQRLSQDAGYLAAPIFISDPAVDYGIGVAVSFVHELNEEDESAEDPPLVFASRSPRISLALMPPPEVSTSISPVATFLY